jgi:2-desacetyl-2-hydroxyethyl bacteriochlorophyllide A dehydrogenase
MMQAMWLEDQNLSLRNDIPVPKPGSGEVLVRVRLAGICATDLEMVRGYYAFTGVPGHEFVGEVVEAPGDYDWVGQRVVGEINISCGKCVHCRAGRRTHCECRSVVGILDRGGVFAEYITLPLENLHRVPDSVPDEVAVFIEPLAAALEIQEQVQIHPSDHVLLIGAGRLGQLVARTLALTGCELVVVVRRETHKQLLTDCNIRTISVEEVSEKNFDLVIDASGSPEGFAIAKRGVRSRGTIVLKSTYKGHVNINLSELVVEEISLVGSRCGPFSPALNLLERCLIDPTPIITDYYSLSDGITAFERAAQPGVLKVLLRPSADIY